MAFRRDKALAAAEKFAAKGQHDRAAKEYQAVVDDDPKDIRSWLLLADCLVRSGQRDKAIDRYLQVAKFYTQDKAPQKALAVYRQVLNLDGSRYDVHIKCAQLFRELGQIPDAVLIYEKVATAYHKEGREKEALELFAAVAEIDGQNVAKRLRLAELYSRAQMVDEAVEAFGRCADALLDEGRVQEYVRVAERLLYHKAVPERMRQLASVYLRLNEPRRALMKLNTLLQESPTDPDNLELFAETFVAMGKKDKAVSVMLELARGERGKGPQSKSNAVRVLKKALDWDPGNKSVQAALADLGDAAAPAAEAEEEDIEELEEIEADDIEELDAEELEMVDDDLEEGTGVPAPVETSLTKEVMSEVEKAEVELEEEGDVDKILHEVRVLFKYRLFEHALNYLDGAFELDPDHVAALGLKAELLGELGRSSESAEIHVRVARLVRTRDPGQASRHVQLALEARPGHEDATQLLADLGPAAAEAEGDAESDTGEVFDLDLGESELAADEDSAIPEAIEPEVDTGVLDDAFGTVEFADEFEEEVLLEADESGTGIPAEVEIDESGLILDEPEVDLDDAVEIAEVEVADSGVSSSLSEPDLEVDVPDEPLGVDLGDDLTELAEGVPREAGPEESAEFSISVDTEVEVEEEPEPIAVEDRFGLEGDEERLEPEPEEEPEPPVEARDWPDISDEIEEVDFFLDRGLEDDAQFALDDLRGRHPDHPAVLALVAKMAGEEAPAVELTSTAAAEAASAVEELALEEDVASPTPSGAAAPLLDFEDDEDGDDYLAAIFAEGPKDEPDKPVEHQARAQVDDADAGTHFDLGTAYREMGLIDDALKEFEAAATDARWKAKALVMMASLQLHRGETDAAIASLQGAIEAARTPDETSEANYELGLIYETIGDVDKAIAQFESVADGFRDKEEKLEALRA